MSGGVAEVSDEVEAELARQRQVLRYWAMSETGDAGVDGAVEEAVLRIWELYTASVRGPSPGATHHSLPLGTIS